MDPTAQTENIFDARNARRKDRFGRCGRRHGFAPCCKQREAGAVMPPVAGAAGGFAPEKSRFVAAAPGGSANGSWRTAGAIDEQLLIIASLIRFWRLTDCPTTVADAFVIALEVLGR